MFLSKYVKLSLILSGTFVAASLLCGCSTTPDYGMVRGRFDVPGFCDFKGMGRDLPKDTDYVGISVSGSYAKRDELPIDVTNKKTVPSEGIGRDVDFAYVTDKLQGELVLDRIYKGEIVLSGFSFGMSTHPSFFTRFFVGVNKERYELGVFSALYYGKWKGNSDVFRYEECYGDSCLYAYSKTSEINYSRVMEGVGGYASLVIDRLAVTTTVSAYNAWLGEEEDMYLTFDMPYLYSLYGGASYWITPHFKFTMGVTDIFNSERQTLIIGGSLGYWR